MKRKNDKRSESRFTPYLDEDEYLIWVGEAYIGDFAYSLGILLGVGMILVFSAFALVDFVLRAPILLCLPLFVLLIAMLWFRQALEKRTYALSNKRLFVLIGNKLSKSEELSNLQDIRIERTDHKGFSLIFSPQKLSGDKEGLPLYLIPHKFEALSHEDAQTAYDLLMAGWKDEAEESEL